MRPVVSTWGNIAQAGRITGAFVSRAPAACAASDNSIEARAPLRTRTRSVGLETLRIQQALERRSAILQLGAHR